MCLKYKDFLAFSFIQNFMRRQLRDVSRSKLLRDKAIQNKMMPGFMYLFDQDLSKKM